MRLFFLVCSLIGLLILTSCSLYSSSYESREWISEFEKTHPLVGTIWDVRLKRYITNEELVHNLARTSFVLIGEKHDNPDHHLIHAELLQSFRQQIPHSLHISFEHITKEQEAIVLAANSKTVETLRALLSWDSSGWPDWKMFRPLYESALESTNDRRAAGISRSELRELTRTKTSAAQKIPRAELLEAPLPATLQSDLNEELLRSHCGMLPDTALPSMSRMQRIRDLYMAGTMARNIAQNEGLNVLLAGNGHIRSDRGVPYYLRQMVPDATISSIAFLEVDPAFLDPADYLPEKIGSIPPFDYIWFTPVADQKDPCADFLPLREP